MWAYLELLVFERYWIGIIIYFLVLLFDDSTVGYSLIESILVLDRLVEVALHVWLL